MLCSSVFSKSTLQASLHTNHDRNGRLVIEDGQCTFQIET